MAYSMANIFVTYVNVDHDLMKIWGQQNRTCATYIEKQLLQLEPELSSSSGPDPSTIRRGMFCFAKYMDGKYYRARIISDVSKNGVFVLFIDYGNKELVSLSSIRIRSGSEENVSKIVPQAEEFVLARVASPQPGWTKEMVKVVRHDLCYNEFKYRLISHVGNERLIQLYYRNDDYANVLIRKGIAREVTVEYQQSFLVNLMTQTTKVDMSAHQNFTQTGFGSVKYAPFNPEQVKRVEVPSNMSSNILQPAQVMHVKQSNPAGHIQHPLQNISKIASHENNYTEQGVSSNSSYQNLGLCNQNINKHSDSDNGSVLNSFNSSVIKALANELKQHLTNSLSVVDPPPHSYITQVLEVGQTCNVYVSYIDDGPWAFSVQLVSSEHELKRVTNDLSSCKLMPVKLPLVLGYPCVAKSCMDGNLCRGVVVNISHSAVKIFFVDYGNTEDLPVSSVFELPPSFFKTKALSQKFALSGLQRIISSDEIKKAFVDVVENQLLVLQVTTLEGDNLPTCELFLNNQNIKRILNEKVRQIRQWKPVPFPRQGEYESVVVTWIENPQKFFIQLKKNENDLANLKRELVAWSAQGTMFRSEELVPGALCICCYSGDDEWYRAVVTSVNPEGTATVFYVDYGNMGTVGFDMLRKLNSGGLIRQMDTQAIQCCLYGFESGPNDGETTSLLEDLILERELRMKVMESGADRIVVQLFDNDYDISLSLIAPRHQIHNTPGVKKDSIRKQKGKIVSSPDDKNGKQSRLNDFSKPTSRELKSPDNKFSSRGHRDGSKPSYDDHFDRRNNFGQKKFDGERFDSKEKFTQRFPLKKSDEGDFGKSFWSENTSDKNWRSSNCGRDDRDFPRDRKKFDGQNKGNNKRPEINQNWSDGKKFNRNEGKHDGKSSSDLETRMKKVANETKLRGMKMENLGVIKSPVKQEDIVPSGSVLKEKIVNLGTSEEVIVTYFINPNKIFLQLLSAKEGFRRMMDDLQQYYSTKLPIFEDAKEGDIVVAKFKEDGVLYRAMVAHTAPLTVRYLDYGNEEITSKERLWPMDKRFMDMEVQCLKCSLPGLTPVDGDSWPSSEKMSEIFEYETYFCEFLDNKDGVYSVKLKIADNGKDVAEELVSYGHAIGSTKFTSGRLMDYNLLHHETFNVYILHIFDASRFYVRIHGDVLDAIDEDIKMFNKSHSTSTLWGLNSVNVGMMCLANTGDKWIRAKVIQKMEDEVLLQTVDYGNELTLPCNQIQALPNSLEKYSPQAVECCLSSAFNKYPDDEKFKNCCDKLFTAFVHDVEDKKLTVTLYNLDGTKLDLLSEVSEAPDEIRPIPSVAIVGQGIAVTPASIASPTDTYIHLLSDSSALEDLNTKMLQFYENGDHEPMEDGGRLCAAKSIADDNWYRAEILDIQDDTAQVCYIDYGNTEDVPLENVKRLDSSFFEHYGFAKKVSLNIDGDDLNVITDKLCSLLLDKECLGYFIKKDDIMFAELIVNNVPVIDLLSDNVRKLHNLSFKCSQMNGLSPVSVEQEIAHCETDLKVFITHVSSPNQFWIHLESVDNELQTFQEDFQKICESGAVKRNIQVGDIVGTLFTDGLWYRAKVTHVEDNFLEVQFIDYGYTQTIDTAKNEVREVPSNVSNVPVFASLCSLKGRWKEGAADRFETIITENQDPFTLIDLGESSKTVDLLQNGVSVTERLKKEGFALAEEESDIVFISHIDSPNNFYIQKEEDKSRLDYLLKELEAADSFEDVTNALDHKVYCAKFFDDDSWYRGVITKKSGEEMEVFFIDYGNSSVTTDIKKLPSHLQSIPGLAINCCLLYGDSNDEWSESACEKFMNYLNDVALKYEIVLQGAQKSVVKLFTETGENLTDILCHLCDKDDRTQVCVSHVNSPCDFYVRSPDDERLNRVTQLLQSADDLENLDEREVGLLCAAKYGDEWRRAEIRKVSGDECEVFFIDWGNTSLTDKLKKLPEGLESIPPLAKNCSLDFSVKNIPESIKEEFINLAKDGEAVFRAHVICPGERDIVSLMLDCKKLEEVLLFTISENSDIYKISKDDECSKYQDVINRVCSIENYEDSNFEYDRNSVTNETDEEKRVKIAISTADNMEGFRSDDEKGVLSNGLFPESEEIVDDEAIAPKSIGDGETEDSNKLDSDERTPETPSRGRLTTDKIVPGSICRGELVEETVQTVFEKTPHSEKMVPGSIASGISLDNISALEEPVEVVPVKSCSLPGTPSIPRKIIHKKINHSDRVLPACASSGTIDYPPPSEKVDHDDKLVSASVNGTAEDSTN